MYGDYKIRASRKGRAFELTLEQFTFIITSPCRYCGTLAPQKLNGVDRIDSSLGYSVTNCVPACTLCNQMKWATPVDKFLEQVKKIYEANLKVQKDSSD